MRTTTLTVLLATLGLVACATTSDPADPGLVVEVTGMLERTGPGGLEASWAGTEIVRVLDYDGFLVCDGEVDVEGIETPTAAPCDGCELNLETIRNPVKELGPDCVREYEIDGWTREVSRYLAFEPHRDKQGLPLGSVWLGFEDGTWSYHADGVLDGNQLAYQDVRVWVSP